MVRTDDTSLRLSRAQGIPHRLIRKTVDSGTYCFVLYAYDAEFGALSLAQFDTLKKVYSGWSQTPSQVKYDPAFSWMLSDFLPPVMQAALEQRFEMYFLIGAGALNGVPIPSNPPSLPPRNAGLETGDVLLVGKDWLQHLAIFVDDDLYFEKAGAGSGDTALYRLTDWDTLTKTWPPDLHGFSWRRFNREALPSSSVLFD